MYIAYTNTDSNNRGIWNLCASKNIIKSCSSITNLPIHFINTCINLPKYLNVTITCNKNVNHLNIAILWLASCLYAVTPNNDNNINNIPQTILQPAR